MDAGRRGSVCGLIDRVSFGGRAQERQRILRRAGIVAAILVLLAVIFLLSGHWILGIIFAAIAAAGVWVYLQARTVR
jgi:hypothetical protein